MYLLSFQVHLFSPLVKINFSRKIRTYHTNNSLLIFCPHRNLQFPTYHIFEHVFPRTVPHKGFHKVKAITKQELIQYQLLKGHVNDIMHFNIQSKVAVM